nr:unnamed protein product [Callosobruchus analis]
MKNPLELSPDADDLSIEPSKCTFLGIELD